MDVVRQLPPSSWGLLILISTTIKMFGNATGLIPWTVDGNTEAPDARRWIFWSLILILVASWAVGLLLDVYHSLADADDEDTSPPIAPTSTQKWAIVSSVLHIPTSWIEEPYTRLHKVHKAILKYFTRICVVMEAIVCIWAPRESKKNIGFLVVYTILQGSMMACAAWGYMAHKLKVNKTPDEETQHGQNRTQSQEKDDADAEQSTPKSSASPDRAQSIGPTKRPTRAKTRKGKNE